MAARKHTSKKSSPPKNPPLQKQAKSLTVDKENPETWLKYTTGSCKTCAATCCTMPIEVRWEDLLRLNLVSKNDLFEPLKTIVARLKKQNIITAHRKESGLFALKQTPEGRCRYLLANRCSVYEKRPLVCRAFPLQTGWRHGFCPKTEALKTLSNSKPKSKA